jgi:hypothetical protein
MAADIAGTAGHKYAHSGSPEGLCRGRIHGNRGETSQFW